MPSAWDDDNATEPTWSDPEAWRGTVHQLEDEPWAAEVDAPWAPAPELPTSYEDELLGDDEDWCPGGWLEDWEDEDCG